MDKLNDDLLIELLQHMPHIDVARLMKTCRGLRAQIKRIIAADRLCSAGAHQSTFKYCARRNHYICLKEKFEANLNQAIGYVESRNISFMRRFFGDAADVSKNAFNIGRGGHTSLHTAYLLPNAYTDYARGLVVHGDVAKLKGININSNNGSIAYDMRLSAIKSGSISMIKYVNATFMRPATDEKIARDAIVFGKLSVLKQCDITNIKRRFIKSCGGMSILYARRRKVHKYDRVFKYLSDMRAFTYIDIIDVSDWHEPDITRAALTYTKLDVQFIIDFIHGIVKNGPDEINDVDDLECAESAILDVLEYYFANSAPIDISNIHETAKNCKVWHVAHRCLEEICARSHQL
jgi:hypothetical protein